MNRAEIRQAISRHIAERNLAVETTSAAGTATTLVCSQLSGQPVDHWRGGEALCVDGPNAGVARPIQSSAGASITTLPFASAVGSGVTVELRQAAPFAASLNQSINEAILAVANQVYVPVSDTSVVYATDTEEYTIPATFTLLHTVQYEASGTGKGDWQPLPASSWQVVQGAGKLALGSLASGKLTNAQPLRLLGYRAPALLTDDVTACEVGPNYVIAYAVGKLLGNQAGGPLTDPDAHAQRQRFWTDVANIERRGIQTRRRQSAWRVRW